MKTEQTSRAENPMAATWTRAATVRRAFKTGRKRQNDLEYDMERAVIECRILFINIRKAMLDAGITTTAEDVKVALVLMTPDAAKTDAVFLLTVPRNIEGLPELYAKASALEGKKKVVPLGVAIWQRDREASKSIDVWVQPWLTNARAARAAIEARKAFEGSDGEETNSKF